MNIGSLTTEQMNEKSSHIDNCSIPEILQIINEEDGRVHIAVQKEIGHISAAVEQIVKSFKAGGRLFYVGAGTSGRLGILDAAECPPTYSTEPNMVQAIIAGGKDAVFSAVEGAEDDLQAGADEIVRRGVNEHDTVVGIAASGITSFVIGAIRQAKRLGASTVGISCNPDSLLEKEVDFPITPVVGPEVVTGSTRMKSGTAQKLVLNMLSTCTMIKLGKVYGNLMVDVKPSNQKLINRCIRIVMKVCGVSDADAQNALEKFGYNPKKAIILLKTQSSPDQVEEALSKADGLVSGAIEYILKK
ncbi:MAG: N-acetylmuramic acid 6-phosphate etherase [Bacillota bacterium]|nr:N-acetylmuramic acid 6-phosphate etherase [Bacillota bacterium]